MRPGNQFDRLAPLQNRAAFTAQDARRLGVHPSLLAYYVKKGQLVKLERGVYRNTQAAPNLDFRWEDLVTTILTIPKGIICLLSALALHNLTDEIPREHWVAVPNSMTAPRRKKLRCVRMRNVTLGKTTVTLGETTVPVFDRERTVVDAFRYLGKETAIRALKAYFASGKKLRPDIKKMRQYAKRLRVPLEPFLLMVTT